MKNIYEKYEFFYKKGEKNTKKNRWIITYADFVTVLLAVFITLFSCGAKFETNEASAEILSEIETIINSKHSAGGENLLLDGVKNPSNSKEITVIEFEKMAEKLNENLIDTKIEIIDSEGQTTIRLAEGVLFDEGSAIIKSNSKKTLDTILSELSKSDKKIRVEGHCDNIPIKNGKYASNWELSTIRATNIVSYLIENGIDKTRLSASGYADNNPVETNLTKEGRAKNRRVDIVITN